MEQIPHKLMMRNINELIGIINGISYDGIINKLEVAGLSSWVKKNRNLSYEPRQARLISLVEQVLEDGIITDEEREMLIDNCSQYTALETDSSAKIYELNGIIEGVISDSEINEKEVCRLQEWMRTNESFIRDHKPSKIICEKIDQILEDGIVTQAEQESLLEILKKRLNDAQIETKIGYLKTCVKERKNLGIDLIDLLDNVEAIDIIHNRAERELGIALNSYSGTYVHDPEIVFVSLVLIGMLYYDGAFYESVRKTYKNLYQRYSEQKVEGLIRTLLNKYRIKDDVTGTKTRIINVVLAGSIVPSYYLGAFFEFIYDIYKLNFDSDLPDDLYGEFRFVYDGLQNVMRSESDELQVNVTKKTYKLIKSTKQLITNPVYNDAVIKLSIIIVRLIDKYIWDKDNVLYNPYLKRGYEEWLSTINREKEYGHRSKSEQLRSRWEPEYVLNGNTVYLVPPIHRVKATYDYRNIRIIVKNEEKKTGKLSLKRKESIQSEPETSNVKQFLAFSDSRQQASFSAAFLDSNQVRMLQKRLIWKVIEDNQYRNISVDQLTATLSGMIKEGNLFQNDLSAHKNAWITTLVDLLKVDGSNDGEGLGLYFFDVDLTDIMSQVDEEDVEAEFGEYNITKKDLETIMQVVFGIFKVAPAINSIKSTLTPDEKMEALEYRRFDNYIMLNCPKTINGVRSFLPVKGKDNMVVRYVQKVCDCDEESAKALLEVVFNNLAVAGELFKKHETKECYQIEASKYVVKNYKTSKYYICSKCGRLTPYNVHNKCVQDKCDGTLSEVDPDEALATNYYRRQYKTKKIESIVVKEHTAQLDRKKAKQYQQDFKNKKINILSCSTTFEMGIDIGNLETVFMRNVPPSPANYVQRAGRAGRRKDSAAYILTYCGTGSHDYTYFCSPEKMISGVIKPPYFNVVNHKIIVRHLMATCLGFFFRLHPDYFSSIDELVFGKALEEFKSYISSHPSDLNTYINEKILPGDVYREYHNFKWFDEIEGNDEKMEHFVSAIKSIAEEYEKAKKEAVTEENYKEADYYQRQIENLHKEKVIDSLSKYCVIPKYGFPVDVVELQIYKEGILDNSYDLSRDLKIAISEYAPDSEIIVDGKKYTSKYISLPKTGEYPRNYFCTCPNCKKINVSVSTRTGNECKYCGEPLGTVVQEFYIEPVNGFKTGITKESTRAKPKRSYAGEVSYLGAITALETITTKQITVN